MKKSVPYIVFILLLFAGAARAQNSGDFAEMPQLRPGDALATFGGGNFWVLSETMTELKGVTKVMSGYAGGTTKNPTYDDVCSNKTGHAECVQVYYNPKEISYETLVTAFFFAHDPTVVDRQGVNAGYSYRSLAFYRTPDEKATLESVIKKINDSKHYPNPIVTEIIPFSIFYPAEIYHQGYYKLNIQNPYIKQVSTPKVVKFRAQMKAELKPEYQNLID